MQIFDVVAIGEVDLDLLVTLPKEGDIYRVEKNELTLPLGEKIPIASSSFSVGGNATHVAIGLSRLGFRSALAVELGSDEFSETILKNLDKEKIAKTLLKQIPGMQSACNISLSAGGDRTILVEHIKHEHNFSFENVQTQWVFLSSMTEVWEDAYKTIVEFVRASGTKLAFNPGSPQLKKGIDSFIDVVKNCDILFVNKEEAEQILYKEVLPPEKKENAESLLFRLQRMGPKMVVITDGENGSYAIDENSKVSMQNVFPVEVTEKTGAGDAFETGFLAAIMSGKDIPTALLWGTADATGVITKVGGQEGLLTKAEIENMIQQHL